MAKPPFRDFIKIKRNVRERRKALELAANHLVKGRQHMQEQLDKLSRIRFFERRALNKALDEAHRKAASVNLDSRVQTALNTFEHRVEVAIDAFETAYKSLLASPNVKQLQSDFLEAEQKYESILEEAETHFNRDLKRIQEDHTKA